MGSTANLLAGFMQDYEPSTAQRPQNRHQLRFPWAVWVTRLHLPRELLKQELAGPSTAPAAWHVPGGLGGEQLQLGVSPIDGFQDFLQGGLNNLCHRE